MGRYGRIRIALPDGKLTGISKQCMWVFNPYAMIHADIKPMMLCGSDAMHLAWSRNTALLLFFRGFKAFGFFRLDDFRIRGMDLR